MAKPSTKYVLESPEEAERLERQSRMRAHDFKPELRYLTALEGQKILDAGCGSGIVSKYLSQIAPRVQVTGWDCSKYRIESAREKYESPPNIEFHQQDLLELGKEPYNGSRFDVIVCRYVLHHFSQLSAEKVIQNLLTVLKPGGIFYCINVEGLFSDIFPSSPFLLQCLKKIRSAKNIDMQCARKTPSLLVKFGLETVDWHFVFSEFKGEERVQEIENLKQTIKNAEPFFIDRLGGAATLEKFKKEYFASLCAEGSVLAYNKVIAVGTKPKLVPSLVKA